MARVLLHHRRLALPGAMALALASAPAAAGPADAPAGSKTPAAHADCVTPGHWQVPGGAVLRRADVVAAAAKARVVLLGENHDDAAHHRWQLDTLAALHRASPGLVLGVEMFPRRLQPVLDAWSRGELGEAAFLEQTDWDRTWGFAPELYMPIFRFVRDHRIPLRALNIDRSEVRKVSGGGWAALDATLRAELGTPAAPLKDYRSDLRQVYDAHLSHLPEGQRPDSDGFERFVEAQLLWDRAMAAGIASQAGQRPVVAMMGSGHIRFGHGVPHQLRDLAITSIYSMVPLGAEEDCEEVREGLADVVVSPAGGPSPHPPQVPETAPEARLRIGL